MFNKNRSRQTRFRFSSFFFPRRYRSGFTTRWHGKHNIIIILRIYTYALVVLSLWFFIFLRAAVDGEKARVGARVRTFWPVDISDSPPPSPVCFKLLLYVYLRRRKTWSTLYDERREQNAFKTLYDNCGDGDGGRGRAARRSYYMLCVHDIYYVYIRDSREKII
jgi:hypothetical protein